MLRLIFAATLTVALFGFAGCAAFDSDSVPPRPSLTGMQAENVAWRDAVHRSRHGGLPTFEPLSDAEDAVQAAEAQKRIDEFDAKSLSQAKQALKQAQDDWQAIAEDDDRSDQALAKVATEANRAERLAQIAQYTAQREIGLEQLGQLQAQQQQQQRQPGLSGGSAAGGGQLVGRRVVPEMLGSLQFEPGTARLTEGSHSVIDRLAKLMAAHPKRGLAIFGFSSSSEPPAQQLKAFVNANPQLQKQDLGHDQQVQAYHKGLSEARARDVAQLLVQAGVDPHRLGARGMGASHPVATNDTAAGRRQNDRAEAVVVPLNRNGGG
ncbi:OmpA family protein [Salinisphaera sp. SPP-AMP-43]|uniref:OmpA family protein n=1 Tax=Salinisphaera sp. SPP-AMP-43 TaxID=3121288 RepID=UPI003C6E2174